MIRFMATFLLSFEILTTTSVNENSEEWWKDSFIYQVYPRSFKDSDGDGVGDINGITQKLDYFVDLGISAIWITPIFESPMVDFGYDITNYKAIDPLFGTMNDFHKLIARAKTLNIKILLDFVPNHTSDKHPWFLKSVQKIKPYDDYYVWVDAKIVNGTRQVPTNWLSHFGGSAWSWNEQRRQYYYCQFAKSQPELNFRNKHVRREMEGVLRFWLARGVDGFRIDTLPSLFEDMRLLDEFKAPDVAEDIPEDNWWYFSHPMTYDPTETYPLLQSWKKILNSHGRRDSKKIILVEAYFDYKTFYQYTDYYHYGSEVPMSCLFTDYLKTNRSSASDYKRVIEQYLSVIPDGYHANWVTSNHDRHRMATRYGRERADQIPMIAAVLPGIVIIYQGDEIGTEDCPVTWERTRDTKGLSYGPEQYSLMSRDPFRCPFQWDHTTSAGFSTSNETWLPVHPDYETLNLAAQRRTPVSHYRVFKKLVTLKKDETIGKGTTNITVVGDNVLGVVRRLGNRPPIVLLVNFSDNSVTVNVTGRMGLPGKMIVYVASVASRVEVGASIDTDRACLPGAASVILVTDRTDSFKHDSSKAQ